MNPPHTTTRPEVTPSRWVCRVHGCRNQDVDQHADDPKRAAELHYLTNHYPTDIEERRPLGQPLPPRPPWTPPAVERPGRED